MKSGLFWVVCIFLSLYILFFAAQKINLATADLGRHIINGKLIVHGNDGVSFSDVLHKNLFSYTYPDFPFVNHHWLSGVVFYLVFILSGWNGLSLLYLACILSAFLLAVLTMKNEVSTSSIFVGSIFLIPLIADRVEVRPEGFSYVFLMMYIFLLYRFSKNQLDKKILWIIPLSMILWVNMHIYFIFGICVIGAFLVESLVYEWKNGLFTKSKLLAHICVASLCASLINPFGLKLTLYPLSIFKQYGYRVVENQSIPFLENIHFDNPSFLWYKMTLIFIIVSVCIVYWIHKSKKPISPFPIALTSIFLLFAIIAYLGIRSMTAYALVSIPLILYTLSHLLEYIRTRATREIQIFVSVCICLLLVYVSGFHFSKRLPWNSNFGIGLTPHVLASGEFLRNDHIPGPIFNNYDIGSYLIWSLFPSEKVFVDNRPETYPDAFFTDTYIPMQEDTDIWRKINTKENFNVIYFYWHDMTPWAQSFLIARTSDPEWAPVYADEYALIFLKRNEKNKDIITQYELPKNLFSVK